MSKKYRKDRDFSNNNTKKLWNYDEAKVSKLIEEMPMEKISNKSEVFSFDGHTLSLTFSVLPELKPYYINGRRKSVNTDYIIIFIGGNEKGTISPFPSITLIHNHRGPTFLDILIHLL